MEKQTELRCQWQVELASFKARLLFLLDQGTTATKNEEKKGESQL